MSAPRRLDRVRSKGEGKEEKHSKDNDASAAVGRDVEEVEEEEEEEAEGEEVVEVVEEEAADGDGEPARRWESDPAPGDADWFHYDVQTRPTHVLPVGQTQPTPLPDKLSYVGILTHLRKLLLRCPTAPAWQITDAGEQVGDVCSLYYVYRRPALNKTAKQRNERIAVVEALQSIAP